MQKTIPLLYFYIVSLIGFILFIIGIFSSVNYFVNIFAYDRYPLGYNPETRCAPMQAPTQAMLPAKIDAGLSQQSYRDCIKSVQDERQQRKVQDAEIALSFTIIGLLIFGVHFSYARLRLK